MKRVLFLILGILLVGIVSSVELTAVEGIDGITGSGVVLDNNGKITQFEELKTDNSMTYLKGINTEIPASAEFNKEGVLTKAEFTMKESGVVKINNKYYELPKGTFKYELGTGDTDKISGDKGYNFKFGDDEKSLTQITLGEEGSAKIWANYDEKTNLRNGYSVSGKLTIGDTETMTTDTVVRMTNGEIAEVYRGGKIKIKGVETNAGASDVLIFREKNFNFEKTCGTRQCINAGNILTVANGAIGEIKGPNDYFQYNNERIKLYSKQDSSVNFVAYDETLHVSCMGDECNFLNGNQFVRIKGDKKIIISELKDQGYKLANLKFEDVDRGRTLQFVEEAEGKKYNIIGEYSKTPRVESKPIDTPTSKKLSERGGFFKRFADWFSGGENNAPKKLGEIIKTRIEKGYGRFDLTKA